MEKEKLQQVLEDHRKWKYSEGGKRADLSDADLSRADLRRADLRRADLSDADLSGADLSGADLSDADLSRADLRRADLRRADLSDADLSGADLSGADLSDADLSDADLSRADLYNTCLDNTLHLLQRKFCKVCPPNKHGGRIVYRTATSQHVGSTKYLSGHTYIAPILSFDTVTNCHPGIYAASLEWMQNKYPSVQLVRCYVRDGDWVISGKGTIRCKRLRVLDEETA